MWDFTWRLSDLLRISGILLGVVSDCEELSGGYLQEEVRLVLVDIDINL